MGGLLAAALQLGSKLPAVDYRQVSPREYAVLAPGPQGSPLPLSHIVKIPIAGIKCLGLGLRYYESHTQDSNLF